MSLSKCHQLSLALTVKSLIPEPNTVPEECDLLIGRLESVASSTCVARVSSTEPRGLMVQEVISQRQTVIVSTKERLLDSGGQQNDRCSL